MYAGGRGVLLGRPLRGRLLGKRLRSRGGRLRTSVRRGVAGLLGRPPVRARLSGDTGRRRGRRGLDVRLGGPGEVAGRRDRGGDGRRRVHRRGRRWALTLGRALALGRAELRRGLRCGGRRGREGRRFGRRRGEPRDGGRLGLLLQDLAAEVLEQRFESAVEALADGREPPDVLAVEVAEHHRALGAELRAVEGVAGDFLAPGDDAQIAGADLRHLARAVDRGGEGELVDRGRHPVEGDPERLRVARLRTELLDRLFGRFGLVEEDEVAVVREPFLGVEAERADVEGEAGPGDPHSHVQIGPRRQVTDPGLVATLEFPGHT